MISTFYLVNNKHQNEPDFPKHMRAAVESGGVVFRMLDIANLSFFCPREIDRPVEIYDGAEKLEFDKNDYVFIRKWHPNGPATALLAFLLQARGIRYSDGSMNLQHDVLSSKLSQPFQLKGVAPFPMTWVTTIESLELNKEQILKTFTFPVVLKLKGAQGKRVWKCESEEALLEKAHAVRDEFHARLLQIQEFVPNDSDIRVVVWKGEILTAIRRSSADGFLNNVSQGGSAEQIELTQDEKEIALAAAKKLDLDLCGVDIVRSEYGSLLFEVNKAPDIAAFNEAAGFCIEEKLAEKILEEN